ncbi:SLC13 family permease [Marinivivus vitaminiproducens]|uniref:SLC13 family permease n=1 Tax=Marinivivus vitaminiproducens TaxID=3035935 RepID=UPI0027A2D476|nr:SLC13 family permease [Geminicoccaceae bacterium SCSIO 64248]
MLPRLSAGQAVGALTAVLGVAFAVLPASFNLPPSLGPIAGVALAALGLYAGGGLPEHVTSLLLFTVVMVFGLAPAETMFAGFASTALWLVFGGLIVGAAVQRTGLGRRLAILAAKRLPTSYRGLIYGVIGLGIGLAFLMPSTMGRIVILIPIIAALAERFGFEPGRPGHAGMVIAASFGTFLPALAILPANLPNTVLIGAMETLYGISPAYGPYFLLQFPVLGFLKAIVIAEVTLRCLPDVPEPLPEGDGNGRWTGPETRLLIVLLGSLGLWVTDVWHGISPGWVALMAGSIVLFPPTRILPPEAFRSDVNFTSFFYVAGILGLGSLIAESGLGELVAGRLFAHLPLGPGQPAWDVLLLSAAGSVIGLMATQPGIPAILSPLAQHLADQTGLPLMVVLMSQVAAWSAMFLPYQSPPLIVGLRIGNVPMASAIRVCLIQAVITVVVLWPLHVVWWRIIGFIG